MPKVNRGILVMVFYRQLHYNINYVSLARNYSKTSKFVGVTLFGVTGQIHRIAGYHLTEGSWLFIHELFIMIIERCP
jgi:hypothetical protein